MSVILADLGGTHLRLAHGDNPSVITKYKIADYSSLDSVLQDFAPDLSVLYLASAITPLNNVIEDKRFTDGSHWRIDLNDVKSRLKTLVVLNDLEAAAYGLSDLSQDQVLPLLPSSVPQIHFDSPPKLLIGIGTGVGHAFLFEKQGQKPFVQRTHGGHIPAFGVTKEQQDVIAMLAEKSTLGRDIIMENVIGGNGLWQLADLLGKETATRLFWEFLGLYCNVLATGAGAYGGIYLTGGIMDDMADNQTIDADSFKRFYLRPLVPVVVESLSATPVSYVRDINLPILGLASYRKNQT